MASKRILVIHSLWPHAQHGVRSANIVLFELLREFARQNDVSAGFLKVRMDSDQELSPEESNSLGILGEEGVHFLPPVSLPATASIKPLWRKLFPTRIVDFYPEVAHQDIVKRSVIAFEPDVLFIPWSEIITAVCADIDIPKFAYYGNPDPLSFSARVSFNISHGDRNIIRKSRELLRLHFLKQLHIGQMVKYEMVGAVDDSHAKYYLKHGHPNAFYVQNVWMDRFGESWKTMRQNLEIDRPVRIIGNIGKLNGTANTYGLEMMGQMILPALRRSLDNIPYEVHIFGAMHPHPAVVQGLDRPEVKMRGFVEDIDRELLMSKIFLCANNASAYKVCHTRYLHAWSLGCCVVGHVDASKSIPEMRHGVNALLGRTPEEMAQWVRHAVEDKVLRTKISDGGYQTFKKHFTASRVVPRIIAKINQKLSFGITGR